LIKHTLILIQSSEKVKLIPSGIEYRSVFKINLENRLPGKNIIEAIKKKLAG
jgi:hypothetical protein